MRHPSLGEGFPGKGRRHQARRAVETRLPRSDPRPGNGGFPQGAGERAGRLAKTCPGEGLLRRGAPSGFPEAPGAPLSSARERARTPAGRRAGGAGRRWGVLE